MSFIVVMAELIPKEGAEEKLIPRYKCLRSITDGTFTFVEEWESVEALSDHLNSTHFKLFSKESADLAKDMEIKVLSAEEVNLYE